MALIARLESEGTFESDLKDERAGAATIKLRLKGDRKKLEGYERSLVYSGVRGVGNPIPARARRRARRGRLER